MKEIIGNLFDQYYGAICITTNGIVKNNGEAVMGAGIALEAKRRIPGIEKKLGRYLLSGNNDVYEIGYIPSTKFLCMMTVYSFPVKHHFKYPADLKLIEKSCQQLVKIRENKDSPVFLPKPGCGAGKLKWSQVKPILEKYFDDRFCIVDLK